jgi:transposase
MAGRPTKLTPETVKKLTDAIQSGATYELACKYAGITYSLFASWRARGLAEVARRDNPRVKDGTPEWITEQPFLDFFEAIQKAEGNAALGWLLKIEQAANQGHWQAAAWKLERRYPQDYGRKVHEVQGKDGGPVVVEVLRGVSMDEL